MDLIISYSQYNFMIDESSITYDLVFLELGINILEKIYILVYIFGWWIRRPNKLYRKQLVL